MEDRFRVRSDRIGDVAVLAVEGAADLATVPDFATHLWRAVDAGEERILIDLSGTRFIDSRMVELLLTAAERLRRTDGRLAITCGGDSIRQVLDLCGVTRILPVSASREESLAALAS